MNFTGTERYNIGKSEQIDIKVHLVRDKVKEGTISLQLVPKKEIIADILTKTASNAGHKANNTILGMKMMD